MLTIAHMPKNRGPIWISAPNLPYINPQAPLEEAHIPTSGNYRIPTSGDYRIPTSGDCRMPKSGDYRMPKSGDYRMPKTGAK